MKIVGWKTWARAPQFPKLFYGKYWWEADGVNARPDCGWSNSLEEAWDLCKRRAKRKHSIASLLDYKPDRTVFVREQIDFDTQNAFVHLRQEWQKERGATSSITTMAMCPSYQSIIAIGPAVIPLILRQMESEGDEPDMWFWALRVLTKADPISDDDRGDIVKMTQTWLDWARGRYVW
jgi:hypothetical protein